MGDWNLPQHYDMDDLNYLHKNNPKVIKKVYEMVVEIYLIDDYRGFPGEYITRSKQD